MSRVTIVPSDSAEDALWRTTHEVAQLFSSVPWVLVGGLMVRMLTLEHGGRVGRTTRDVDVVVDVRAVAGGLRLAAERLAGAGFAPSAEHPYRFARGLDAIDLLAPDHLGRRADLTTIPPQTTIEVAGGRRALDTRRLIEVDIVGIGATGIPVPSVPGAIVLKCAAYSARRAARDLEDLVRLLALVADVEATRADLKPAERRRLGAIVVLRDPAAPVWTVVSDPRDARAALSRLADD